VTVGNERRELIDRYVAAYNQYDVEGMLAVMHPEVEFRNVAAGEVTVASHGREEFRAIAERAATLVASRRQTVREYGDDGVQAWITVDYDGVLAADLGPELPAGTTLRLSGRSTFSFRDGWIVQLVDES